MGRIATLFIFLLAFAYTIWSREKCRRPANAGRWTIRDVDGHARQLDNRFVSDILCDVAAMMIAIDASIVLADAGLYSRPRAILDSGIHCLTRQCGNGILPRGAFSARSRSPLV